MKRIRDRLGFKIPPDFEAKTMEFVATEPNWFGKEWILQKKRDRKKEKT